MKKKYIIKEVRRHLSKMPFDKMFDLGKGFTGWCHATGDEVYFPGLGWWTEYVDQEGNLHYGG